MSKSSRRPQQLYTVIMWLLSVVFAGFLIGLGSLIIADLPKFDQQNTVEDFVNTGEMSRIDGSITITNRKIKSIRRNNDDAEVKLKSATADYQNDKASLDNWLKTRTATESAAQNPDVIKRTRTVEAFKQAERNALRNLEDITTESTQAQRQISDLKRQRADLLNTARPKYMKSQRARELRVFLLRLALTLPLLIIGGWLLAKKCKSGYWPLYRGFVIFALFAFFVELVPYLPSYGGYVRYAVGIMLIFVAGHFIIRGMRSYLDRKQVEESRSEGERRQSIEYETALKKIAAKTCPGCDRNIIKRDGVETDFCVHCGIRLENDCTNCGTRNVSFHRFCLSCGTPSSGK